MYVFPFLSVMGLLRLRIWALSTKTQPMIFACLNCWFSSSMLLSPHNEITCFTARTFPSVINVLSKGISNHLCHYFKVVKIFSAHQCCTCCLADNSIAIIPCTNTESVILKSVCNAWRVFFHILKFYQTEISCQVKKGMNLRNSSPFVHHLVLVFSD